LKVEHDSKNRTFTTKKHAVNGIERSEKPCPGIVSAEIVSSFQVLEGVIDHPLL